MAPRRDSDCSGLSVVVESAVGDSAVEVSGDGGGGDGAAVVVARGLQARLILEYLLDTPFVAALQLIRFVVAHLMVDVDEKREDTGVF